MPPPAQPDPFDFSDFAGQVPAATLNGDSRHSTVRQPHSTVQQSVTATATGFDPFVGQPGAVRAQTAGDEVFTAPSSTAPLSSLMLAGPPLMLFCLAFAAAIFGVVLSAVAIAGSAVLPAFIGWLLAGPAAIGMLAWFTSADTRRRLSSVYSAPTWLRSAYWAVISTCAFGIGAAAWQIALWAGRL